MKNIIFFTIMTAMANVIYHLGQKSLPHNANPMILLMAAYGIGFLLAGLLAPFFQQSSYLPLVKQICNPAVLVVGVSALIIELGFLYLYRVGGSLQWSSPAVSGLAALTLISVSVLVYGESLSFSRAGGIFLIFIGLLLSSR